MWQWLPLHKCYSSINFLSEQDITSSLKEEQRPALMTFLYSWLTLARVRSYPCIFGSWQLSHTVWCFFSPAETWTCLSSWSIQTPALVVMTSSPCPTTTAAWAEATVSLSTHDHGTSLLFYRWPIRLVNAIFVQITVKFHLFVCNWLRAAPSQTALLLSHQIQICIVILFWLSLAICLFEYAFHCVTNHSCQAAAAPIT